MQESLNRFHKEYSCNPKIVEKERKDRRRKCALRKLLWGSYLILLISSFFLLPIWITSLLFLVSMLLPPYIEKKDASKDTPFLIVDSKYIQFKGRIILWSTISKIHIQQETIRKKEMPSHFNITFHYSNGRAVDVATRYFPLSEDIVSVILALAEYKNIPVESEIPVQVSQN